MWVLAGIRPVLGSSIFCAPPATGAGGWSHGGADRVAGPAAGSRQQGAGVGCLGHGPLPGFPGHARVLLDERLLAADLDGRGGGSRRDRRFRKPQVVAVVRSHCRCRTPQQAHFRHLRSRGSRRSCVVTITARPRHALALAGRFAGRSHRDAQPRLGAAKRLAFARVLSQRGTP